MPSLAASSRVARLRQQRHLLGLVAGEGAAGDHRRHRLGAQHRDELVARSARMP